MKNLADFLKTTLVGGLLVVLPVILAVFLIDEALALLKLITMPIVEHLPESVVKDEFLATVLGLAILLLLSFITGLAMKTKIGSGTGNWFEKKVLNRIPGYSLVKSATRQFVGSEDEECFQPAVVRIGEERYALAYIIEETEDGFTTVLLPSSPAGASGYLQHVRSDQVRKVDANLGDVFTAVTRWGVGTGPFFKDLP